MAFRDRAEAGRRLAEACEHLRDEDPVVLALPRGGVPVAVEVAHHLGAPLDVLVVRKVGLPSQPELGVGAVGEDGERVFNHDLLREVGMRPEDLARVVASETEEVGRRVARYRGDRPAVEVAGRTAVVVDDGIATGFTVRAGVEILRERGAARVVVAVPVAPERVVAELGQLADEVVCLSTPSPFRAIGLFYDDFTQVSDREVLAALGRVRGGAAGADDVPHRDVVVDLGDVALPGFLDVPSDPAGLVVFAHGSGSSRHSPRNQAVARALQDAGWATLLLDLLTEAEARDRDAVFDVERLGRRLAGVVGWAHDRDDVGRLPVALFGASTGAGAALVAATAPGTDVAAVVSRGGRPDLAGDHLGRVTAPTLLVVGGEDRVVLDLNRRAHRHLQAPTDLVVVPGATHLFEEPGALDQVVTATLDWLDRHGRRPTG